MVTSRACTVCRLVKPLTEFYKHPVGKFGRQSKCIPCFRAANMASYRKHRASRLEALRRWKRQWSRTVGRKEQFRLPPEFSDLDVGVGWRSSSKEYARIRERERYETDHRYKTANLIKSARRRASQVPWADEEKIGAIYAEARRLTTETGIQHHVDHIVPIKHRMVCGLHVENNLRIVTASENLKKKNRFSPC